MKKVYFGRHRLPSSRIAVLISVLIALAALLAGASAAQTSSRHNGRIAFQRQDSATAPSRSQIFTIRPNGTGLKQLTTPPSGALDFYARWSPDGSELVFGRRLAADTDNEQDILLLVNPNGKGLHQLTRDCTGTCLGDDEPSWSPDGRRIAFDRAFIGPDGNVVAGLFVTDIDGNHVRQLTQTQLPTTTEDHLPSWSPDGKRIVFMRMTTDFESTIYTIKADGTDLRLVIRLPLDRPGGGESRWSPDGSRILFSDYCVFGGGCPASTPASGANLFTIRPNGTGLRKLTDGNSNSYNPGWSPDGKKIVFARFPRRGGSILGDVYTMNADGSHVTRVTNTPLLDAHHPDWGSHR
jgi:TolB protein